MKAVLRFESIDSGYVNVPSIYVLSGITLRLNNTPITFPFQESLTIFEIDSEGRLSITSTIDNFTEDTEYNVFNLSKITEVMDIGIECFMDEAELTPVKLRLVSMVSGSKVVPEELIYLYNLYCSREDKVV